MVREIDKQNKTIMWYICMLTWWKGRFVRICDSSHENSKSQVQLSLFA